MTTISNKTLDFLTDLKKNNDRDWFNTNKHRYTQAHENVIEFADELLNRLNKRDNIETISGKKSLYRIYRDVRFSKDKSPYKLGRSAAIGAGGKKDKTTPSLYFELSPEHARVYTGVYQPDKDQLLAVREEIADNLEEFESIVNEKKFKKIYGEVRGEKNARIPKELKEAGEKQPLIYNKQLYVFATFDPEEILKEGFEKKIVETYKIAQPFADFLAKPILNLRG